MTKNPTKKRFDGVLSDASRGGCWVEVPFDAKAEFGEARAPVTGTVNGTPLRTRLAVYGGRTYLGLTKEVRETAGIEVGDPVAVVLERDDAPRVVDVPPELAEGLRRDAIAREFFDGLSFTHRKEYARWINDAKQEKTRAARVAKTLTMLRGEVKHP
jgi:hypothetical protein